MDEEELNGLKLIEDVLTLVHLNKTMGYIAVIGAGSWGTVLANLLGEKGYNITLWAFEKELSESLQKDRINNLYLPDIKISGNITVTNSLKEAVENARYLLIVVPAQFVRDVLKELIPYINSSMSQNR